METKHLTFEKKDRHKLLTFLGIFIAFVFATLILYIMARNQKSSVYAPMIAIALPFIAGIEANYLGKKSDEKTRKTQDSWNNSEDELGKTKKSRFSKFGDSGFGDISIFGATLSIISAYLSIYLSEVLNLTRDLQKQYPNDSFSSIFIDVVKNIFSADWSRKYLIEYWLWATFFIVVLIGATIWGVKKIEKMKKEEQEGRERNRNNQSKFN